MRIARARLVRTQTSDGLVVSTVPIGTEYEVDLDRIVKGYQMVHLGTGTKHAKDVIAGLRPGGAWGWVPLDLLEVEVPRGFTKEA